MKKNIYDLCNQKIFRRDTLFNEFAIFFIIFSVFPYLIWKNDNSSDSYILKIIGGSMCVFLLVKDFWQDQYQKYFGIFWYICVFFCLPLTSSVILFQNYIEEWALINMIFSILILSLLVDWDIFLILLISGLLISALYVESFYEKEILQMLYTEQGGWLIYALTFSIVISFLFIRKHESFYNLSLNKAKHAFGMVCHEIKTPLSKLQLVNTNFCNKLITDVEGEKEKYINKFNLIMQDIYYVVDDILVKLQLDKELTLEKIILKKEITNIIEEYPFKNQERDMLKVNLEDNFSFLGNRKVFKSIMFNIINNSIYYVSHKNNPRLLIYTEKNEICNVLIIEDNGLGILDKDILLIFKSFYSKKPNGIGLGLFFCKQVMIKFGGDIFCESKLGEYTKFKLLFPIIEAE